MRSVLLCVLFSGVLLKMFSSGSSATEDCPRRDLSPVFADHAMVCTSFLRFPDCWILLAENLVVCILHRTDNGLTMRAGSGMLV